MADTERTYSALIALLSDGAAAHSTNRQLLRDFLKSVHLYPTLAGEAGVVSERYSYSDVRRFGAVGDGATDDTTAIQACITSAIARKGVVYFPAPSVSYRITAALNVTAATRVAFIGDPRGVTISQATASAYVFAGTSVSKLTFDGLTLAGTFTIGIRLAVADEIKFKNLDISGGTTRDGTSLTHCGGILVLTATNVLFDNVYCHGNGSYGGSPLVKGSDIQIGEDGLLSSNCRAINCRCESTSVKSNIAFFDCDGWVWDNNKCSGARTLGTSGGYAFVAYEVGGSGNNRNGRSSKNHAKNTEGSGFYFQTLIHGSSQGDTAESCATVQTEVPLNVGNFVLSDCTDVAVSNPVSINSGWDGIVIGHASTATGGCSLSNPTVNGAVRKGIRLGGFVSGLSIAGGSVRNPTLDGIGNYDNGGATNPMDHIDIVGVHFDTIGWAAITLSNTSNSSVIANPIKGCGRQGVVMGSGGDSNTVAHNPMTGANGLTGFDDIYVTTTNSDVRNNQCVGTITMTGAGSRQLNNRASAITLSGGAASAITTDTSKNLLLVNPAGNDFAMLQLGGTTSSFPALQRGAAAMSAVTADGLGYTTFNAKRFQTQAGAVCESIAAATYTASITINALLGNAFSITATNGTAFTINAPTGPGTGQALKIIIKNTSGGALGVITWNAVFKMPAWTSPATGFNRSIGFVYDGANWIENFRSAVDVPN